MPSAPVRTPDQFRKLVDTAHGMGIAVIMDLVIPTRSAIPWRTLRFDGTDDLYFHAGPRGTSCLGLKVLITERVRC